MTSITSALIHSLLLCILILGINSLAAITADALKQFYVEFNLSFHSILILVCKIEHDSHNELHFRVLRKIASFIFVH